MPDALLVSSSFLPGHGGIESYLAELCGDLSPRIAVLAPATRDGKPIPSDLPYEARGYPTRVMAPTRRLVKTIIATARDLDVDRVLFGTPWPLILLAPALARAGLRYATIVHGAEMLVPAVVPGLGHAFAKALAGADVLFPVSNFTGDRLRKVLARRELPAPPIERLGPRVDVTRFDPAVDTTGVSRRYEIPDNARVVLFFGRLVVRKGAHRLLDALPRIAEAEPRTVAVVAGTGSQLKKLERRAGANVIFTGRVPDEDAPGLYARADVFAMPVVDRWFGLEVEGLGVVLLEAAACGTPCVAGRSGGTPEAVVDGVTGYVVDASSAELGARITELLGDSDRAVSMGAAGRRHVIEGFARGAPPQPLLDWLT